MKRKSHRVRDLHCGNALTVGEIINWLKNFGTDQPVIIKHGNRNFRPKGDKTIQGKPVLIVD